MSKKIVNLENVYTSIEKNVGGGSDSERTGLVEKENIKIVF